MPEQDAEYTRASFPATNLFTASGGPYTGDDGWLLLVVAAEETRADPHTLVRLAGDDGAAPFAADDEGSLFRFNGLDHT
jgi:hypothetical protein